MNDSKGAIERWEGQVEEFKMSASYKELTGIDGEPIEFEYNTFPGFTSLQILQEIRNNLQKLRESHVYGGNIIMVTTGDVLSFALVYPGSFHLSPHV